MLDEKLKRKLSKLIEDGKTPHCPICNKPCYIDDVDNLEYIKTRRKTDIFVHTQCMKME